MHRIHAISEKDPGTALFIVDWLGILIDHDAVGRSELVETLSTFLENNSDYNDTAQALGMHRSTVRYRVHRIRELTQLDLHDPDTRLNLQVATRVLARLPVAPRPPPTQAEQT
jgi:DNA-binding PucR family transcriptional regulator